MQKVLFVGSFKDSAKDGSVGGQMFACTSLIRSGIKDSVTFVLIDSTAESVPAPSVSRRLIFAIKRLILFVLKLISKRPSSVLIFSSAGYSFIEKGCMVLLARPFCNNIIFAPRSGLIENNIRKSRLFRLFAVTVLKNSSKIICQGEYWRNYFGGLIGCRPSLVIVPNWINTDKYSAIRGNFAGGPIQIGYIGWLEKYKGIFLVLEAARLLKDVKISFHLNLYGSGSEVDSVAKFLETYDLNDYVTLHGWVAGESKTKALQNSDIYVHPSFTEGFPNALLEAMACSLPVIASNVGIMPEIINDGYNGLLFDSYSSNDLFEKIRMLCLDTELRERIGANAAKTVLERYSIEFAEKRFREAFNLV